MSNLAISSSVIIRICNCKFVVIFSSEQQAVANLDGTDFRVSCDVPLSFVSCAVWEPNQQELTFWLCTFKNTYKVLIKFSPVVCYNNYKLFLFLSQDYSEK